MTEVCGNWLELLKSGEDSDVTFLLGKNEVPVKCHKLVLKTRASTVFAPMFSERWKQSEEKGNEFVIKLPDVNPAAFMEFLKYIYGSEFDMKNSTSLAIDVLYIAKKYLVDSLIQECVKYLTSDLTMSRAIETIDLLLKVRREDDEVFDHAVAFIVKNFADLLEHDGLGRLDEPTWIYLLKREDLVLSEFQIFRTIHKWATLKQIGAEENGDLKETLKELLKKILPYIRFPTMRPDHFVDRVVPLNLLDTEVSFDLLCYMNSATDRKRLAKKFPFSIKPRLAQAKKLPFSIQPRPAQAKKRRRVNKTGFPVQRKKKLVVKIS